MPLKFLANQRPVPWRGALLITRFRQRYNMNSKGKLANKVVQLIFCINNWNLHLVSLLSWGTVFQKIN